VAKFRLYKESLRFAECAHGSQLHWMQPVENMGFMGTLKNRFFGGCSQNDDIMQVCLLEFRSD
jgi:hypothetical protein